MKDQINKFNFPKKVKLTKTIHDCITQEVVHEKYYYTDRYDYSQITKNINR